MGKWSKHSHFWICLCILGWLCTHLKKQIHLGIFGVAATESLLKVVHDSLAQNRNSSCLLASKQRNTMQLQDLYFPTTILWNLEVLSRIMFITPFIDCYNQCVATCNNISCWVAAWSASFVRPCKCKELSVVEVLNMQMNPNKASLKTTNRMPHINVRNWENYIIAIKSASEI